jgi:hypothetical protein
MPSPSGFSLAHQVNPYHLYDLSVQYKWDSGVLDCPVAYHQADPSNTATAAAVQASKPQGRKVVTFHMRRQGAAPQIPDPNSAAANEKLLTADVVLKEPNPSADGGNYLYEAKGVYVYMLYAPVFREQQHWPMGSVESPEGPGRQEVTEFATGGHEG